MSDPQGTGLISEIEFSDPPPARASKYDWDKIARKLKRRPNKWALIYEGDSSGFAVAIRAGKVSALRPDHGFGVRTANNTSKNESGPRRTCDLYLIYNPDADTRRQKAGK